MKKSKIQIFIVHGGMTFKNRRDYLSYLKNREVSIERKIRWSDDYLDKKLANRFDIIRPMMPLSDNARYEDWKLCFESYFSKLKGNIILIGSSLGGIFLAKYLSENKFPKKILSVYLICPPFDNTLPGEDLVGGFSLKSDLSKLDNSSKNLYLLFSEDDNVVPVSQAEKYRNKLKNAKIKIYKSKNGHFKIKTFPEIVKMINNDVANHKKKE
jgi:predicted alpha/beta hydrolase family esterase